MLFLQTGAKLVTYLVCMHLALVCAYRLYWFLNRGILSRNWPVSVRSVFCSMVAVLPLATVLLVTIPFARLFGAEPMDALGLGYTAHAAPLMISGGGIGFACVLLMVLGGKALGFIHIRRPDPVSDEELRWPRFFGGLTDFFAGSVLEEIIMRGMVLYLLFEAWGGVAAVLGSAMIFSAFHLIAKRSRIPFMFTLNAVVFGILTGVCVLQTGDLWLSIGLHFGWNVTACPVLGLPCYGSTYDRGVMTSDVSGPEWFTGGRFSPDAGVLGTIALLAAAASLRAVTFFI